MTRPAKGRHLLFQRVSSTSTHWPAYYSSICSSENTPWGNRVVFFFLAIFLVPCLCCSEERYFYPPTVALVIATSSSEWRQGHSLPLDPLSGRDVIAAAPGGDQGEVSAQGVNTRFVVTDLEQTRAKVL